MKKQYPKELTGNSERNNGHIIRIPQSKPKGNFASQNGTRGIMQQPDAASISDANPACHPSHVAYCPQN